MRTPNLARPVERRPAGMARSASGVGQSDCCGSGQCCVGACIPFVNKCAGICVPNIGQC
ncbi:hypothetical protein [Jiella sonneratiae]|uniref:Uncharacterized protein n=1 Tax=Jiella sonneratiae TaxID=2816856 RepID=A0ABS3IYU7_9HYPH|nr:hypothetical protein [Jiella sonneratiae]MBO0902095.1 hypothetical protein [Jiella sonneratiae]